MKLLFLALILPIILLGCISQQITEPEIEEEISFESEYSLIIQKEGNFDFNSLDDINNFGNFLNEKSESFENNTDSDSLAILKFINFRMNFLEVQRNVLLLEEIVSEDLTCDEEEKIIEGINYVDETIANIEATINSIEDFNSTFPEYLNKTRISQETIENLEFSKEESKEIKQAFTTELEKC